MYDFYSLNPDLNKPKDSATHSISLTINEPLTNDTFYQLFQAYYYNQTPENEDALGNHLNAIDYLIAFLPSDEHTNTSTSITIHTMDDLNLLISTTEEREVFLPVFTDSRELAHWYDGNACTLTVPARWLWKFILQQKNFNGIVFNPGTIGWDINLEHIASLLNDII